MCLPLLVWTCRVFLGSGVSAQLVTGVLGAAMFLWVYRNLQKLPTLENPTTHLPQRPANGADPQACRINVRVRGERLPLISSQRRAPPLTLSAFQDGRWFCSPQPAPHRDWGIRRPPPHAAEHRRQTSVCHSSDRRLSV